MPKVHLTRRELVASATAAGALAAVPPAWGKTLLSRRPRVGPGTFLDGVASGEPSATAVTFWSRLTTGRARSGARLVVARDAGMRRVVATTIVPTGAGVGNALKARIGRLRPATEYFYAWESGGDVSPIGRTRTAPAAGSAQSLQMAFSSCQRYSLGHFTAHSHASALDDLDLYLFLGDYVYERSPFDMRSDGPTANDLRSYRRKYQVYRSDPGLRELHRLQAIAHVWDDHEVANNYSDSNPAPAAAQRAAGYRAAFEWLPKMTFPRDRHRIYKRLRYGRTADVFLLDERQYRTGSGDGQPRRILGESQMAWLIDQLRRSPATWKVIAQQVVVAPIAFSGGRGNPDAWNGFQADRERLMSEIERAGIKNVVFLTGDAHVFMVNQLASDFEALGNGSRGPSAFEYVGGSVTSLGFDVPESEVREQNPWNLQYDGARHGYAHLDLTAERLLTEYRASDSTSLSGSTVPLARFQQPAGVNQVERTG